MESSPAIFLELDVGRSISTAICSSWEYCCDDGFPRNQAFNDVVVVLVFVNLLCVDSVVGICCDDEDRNPTASLNPNELANSDLENTRQRSISDGSLRTATDTFDAETVRGRRRLVIGALDLFIFDCCCVFTVFETLSEVP